jgi:hypothetical protein
VAATLGLAACSDPVGRGSVDLVPPSPRRSIVWLDTDGLDEGSAIRLQRVGVDQVVVRRGSVRLTGGAPVLRLTRPPEVAGSIPIAIALRVEEMSADADLSMARAMWGALEAELEGLNPSELILDLPTVPPGAGEFLGHLAEVSSTPVVPVITIKQLHRGAAAELAGAVRECIVPVFGSPGLDLRGVNELPRLALDERLAPLVEAGLKVRLGVVLRPLCKPSASRWGESLDLLTEEGVADVSTSSDLDRTFIFNRSINWSSRQWKEGDEVAIQWIDAARLHFYLTEMSRLKVPDLAGWDLVPLPPLTGSLGLDRSGLVEYLGGRGPAPDIDVSLRRRGRDLWITVSNRSPFGSAISKYGNYVEVAVEPGVIVAEDRGDFDRVVLGSRRTGQWETTTMTAADAVRLIETYVAPRERITTGRIRLPSTRSRAVLRWSISTTVGTEVTGQRNG